MESFSLFDQVKQKPPHSQREGFGQELSKGRSGAHAWGRVESSWVPEKKTLKSDLSSTILLLLWKKPWSIYHRRVAGSFGTDAQTSPSRDGSPREHEEHPLPLLRWHPPHPHSTSHLRDPLLLPAGVVSPGGAGGTGSQGGGKPRAGLSWALVGRKAHHLRRRRQCGGLRDGSQAPGLGEWQMKTGWPLGFGVQGARAVEERHTKGGPE